MGSTDATGLADSTAARTKAGAPGSAGAGEHRGAFSSGEAAHEAGRCLYCFDAPCARACPAGIDVAEFIRRIATRNLDGSARLLLEANPLAASCARVCPTLELCEGRCVLRKLGVRPVAIARLQRHAMDAALARGLAPAAASSAAPGRVAVVGAGPAGIACASVLRRLGHAVVVFDERQRPGGLGTYAIADHKISAEGAAGEAEWLARSLGFELRLGVRVGRDVPFAELERDFEAGFLAIGLTRASTLGIPGESLKGVVDALDLIAGHRSGGALPAALDARYSVVVGGGNTAVDAATLALRLGAKRSTLVYRRSAVEMPAYAEEIVAARDAGVDLIYLHSPTSIEGDKRVARVRCQPMKLGDPDASGRRRPVPSGGPDLVLSCDVLVRALGQTVDDRLLAGLPGVRLQNGLVRVDERTGRTDAPRWYAGGDCTSGGREVVHAVAEGKRAALAIHNRLSGKEV
jgi:dihydropyrimidine dehydrogenase (NAD+) subunit PreT